MVAVHEIEAAAVVDALPQRMRAALAHLVPPHVRHLERSPAAYDHRASSKAHDASAAAAAGRGCRPPRSSRTASAARCRCRGTAGSRGLDHRPRAGRSRRASRMQSGIALWPGQHDAVGAADRRRVAVTTIVALGRDVRERLRHRAQVAHSVVDDGDCHLAIDRRRTAARAGRRRSVRGYERSLGRRDHAGRARVGLHGHAQRARERLEHASRTGGARCRRAGCRCAACTSAWLAKPWKNSCARSTSNVADHARA